MEEKLYRTPVIVSVLLHAALCVVFVMLARSNALLIKPAKQSIMIEIEPLTKTKDDKTRQVVQSTAGQKTKNAEDDAYLGRETRTVDRETVAKIQNSVINPGATAKPVAKTKQEQQAQTKETVKKGSKITALANLGVNMLPKEQEKPKDTARWADYAETFGAVPNDYVQGMKESESTALNTREFVYYTYFQRIRTQLDRAWQTILREKLQKLYWSGRSIASDQDHTTKTVVTLDKKGEITRIQLLEESGVVDLDDAAVKAFNKAGPFPNPPREMVDKSGEIQIHWDFILKT